MKKSILALVASCSSLVGLVGAQNTSQNPLANSTVKATASSTQSPAGPTVLTGYTDHATWLSATGTATVMVNFDSLADGTQINGTGALAAFGVLDTFGTSVHGSGVPNQYVTASTSLPFSMFYTGSLPSEPNFFSNDLAAPVYATGDFTMVLDGAATAAGGYIADAGSLGNMGIEVFNGSVSLGSISLPPRDLPDSFAGIVSTTPFTSVRFFALNANDSWGLDNFEHNAGIQVGVPFCGCDVNPPCGNMGTDESGCANSTGLGAMLVGGGSDSAGVDDLVFTCSQLPVNKPSLLFAGPLQANGGAGNLFGDGRLCVGGGIQRLTLVFSNASGDAHYGPGIISQGGWSSGMTRQFQVWFRNPTGPCGGGFNTSNGVEVLFQP